MIYVYFTFKEDAAALALSVGRLREVVGAEARIFVVNDAAAPIPDEQIPRGVEHFRSNYERGGTGKGIAALRGQLEAIRGFLYATGEVYALKIDSDIWVNDLGPFEREPDGTPPADMLACEGSRALLPMGCTYRLSRWAVEAALKLLDERPARSWPRGTYAEAITLWQLLALTRLVLRLVPSHRGYLSGFYLPGSALPRAVAGAGLIHCGEPHMEGGELVRASRELTRTRMLLLQIQNIQPNTAEHD